jgi:hypothetical protein
MSKLESTSRAATGIPVRSKPVRSKVMADSDDLIDAKIAAAEARSDTKVARLEGKLDIMLATISGKLDAAREVEVRDHEYNRNTRWILAGLIVASIGIVLAALNYSSDQFSKGDVDARLGADDSKGTARSSRKTGPAGTGRTRDWSMT